MNKVLNVLIVLIILGLIGYKIYQRPKYSSGTDIPQFKAVLMDGSSFSLSDLKGKYVMLDFWGSWCGPCRKDNPNLVQLYNEYNTKNFVDASGYETISVGIETSEKQWKKAIEKDGLIWKYHIVQTDRFKSELALKYGVREIPTKYLLDPRGQIIAVNPSYLQTKEILDAKLSQ